MYTNYQKFLTEIVPGDWYTCTTDKNGASIYFTAQQFADTLNQENPDEERMLQWDYAFKWVKNRKAEMQWYEHLDHPAMKVRWIYKNYHYPLVTTLPTTLPTEPAQLGERLALIQEAASLDTENDYETLSHRCIEEVLPRHWQRHAGAPVQWNTQECADFAQQFSEAWIAAYSDASVRRMKALATSPRQFVKIG